MAQLMSVSALALLVQDEADEEARLAYVHEGNILVESNGSEAAVQINVTSSLLYPYIAPVFRIVTACAKVDTSLISLPLSAIACIEAEVNVTVPTQHQQDPLPAQLTHLCSAIAAAAEGFIHRAAGLRAVETRGLHCSGRLRFHVPCSNQ
jgi:hypothetical protein